MVNQVLINQQKTRDNLGRQDTTRTPLMIKFGENIAVEEGPTKIIQIQQVNGDGSDVFILGNSDFGALGTSKLGNTEYPNGLTTNLNILHYVINSGNKFHEHFKFNEFINLEKTTATLDLITNKIK